ncbi:MAG: hypothetical protein NZL83_01460 [Candidatus Absconditabacterales bacterium]|nr:hypothetical protein [Candidatus Absconditabacterales bacterium]
MQTSFRDTLFTKINQSLLYRLGFGFFYALGCLGTLVRIGLTSRDFFFDRYVEQVAPLYDACNECINNQSTPSPTQE